VIAPLNLEVLSRVSTDVFGRMVLSMRLLGGVYDGLLLPRTTLMQPLLAATNQARLRFVALVCVEGACLMIGAGNIAASVTLFKIASDVVTFDAQDNVSPEALLGCLEKVLAHLSEIELPMGSA